MRRRTGARSSTRAPHSGTGKGSGGGGGSERARRAEAAGPCSARQPRGEAGAAPVRAHTPAAGSSLLAHKHAQGPPVCPCGISPELPLLPRVPQLAVGLATVDRSGCVPRKAGARAGGFVSRVGLAAVSGFSRRFRPSARGGVRFLPAPLPRSGLHFIAQKTVPLCKELYARACVCVFKSLASPTDKRQILLI